MLTGIGVKRVVGSWDVSRSGHTSRIGFWGPLLAAPSRHPVCGNKARRRLLLVINYCDFIQFRKYTGLSGSTNVYFFLHRFSRKIGISTGIEVVFGALFNCGCVACFLMFFFFFLVNCRYKSNGPKNVTFQFFVGPFLMISKSTFWCLQ